MNPVFKTVLSTARRNFHALWPHHKTNAAFDFGLTSRDKQSDSWQAMKNGTWDVATSGMTDADHAAKEAAYTALWDQLKDDIDAYVARCAGRKYTGWSYHSRGPIRYADSGKAKI